MAGQAHENIGSDLLTAVTGRPEIPYCSFKIPFFHLIIKVAVECHVQGLQPQSNGSKPGSVHETCNLEGNIFYMHGIGCMEPQIQIETCQFFKKHSQMAS